MTPKIIFCCATSLESNNETEFLGFPIKVLGVGKVVTAYRLGHLIASENPDIIVNFGSCGSKKHPVATLLEVGISAQADFDATPLVPEREVLPFEDQNPGKIHFNSESSIECVTSDTFIDQSKFDDISPSLIKRTQTADCFEMELYSYAKACNDLKIKLLSYKWVSDDGDDGDWIQNCKIGYQKFKETFSKKFETLN